MSGELEIANRNFYFGNNQANIQTEKQLHKNKKELMDKFIFSVNAHAYMPI